MSCSASGRVLTLETLGAVDVYHGGTSIPGRSMPASVARTGAPHAFVTPAATGASALGEGAQHAVNDCVGAAERLRPSSRCRPRAPLPRTDPTRAESDAGEVGSHQSTDDKGDESHTDCRTKNVSDSSDRHKADHGHDRRRSPGRETEEGNM